MTNPPKLRGRPGRYAPYDKLLAGLPKEMTKRPLYVNGIGLFQGERGITAWVKIKLPRGGSYGGKAYEAGKSIEIKLGNLNSWSWAQLEARRDELQGRAERGEPLEDAQVVRFATFAEEWLKRAKTRTRGWDTLLIHYTRSLKPFFGTKDLKTITVADVNRWQSDELSRPKPKSEGDTLSPGYVKRQFNTLRAILNDAVRSGLIDRNPCQFAEPIKGMVVRQHYLTLDQTGTLVDEAAKLDGWLGDYLSWLIHSGMRPGEPLGLRWNQVGERPDGKRFITILTSKSGKPRPVTCTPTMVEILERQKTRKLDGDDRIFPIAESTLKRRVNRLRQIPGFAEFRLHDLRRTNMTHLVSRGVDLRSLQGRVGHSDLSMMEKHYAVYLGDDDAADTAEMVFGPSRRAYPHTVEPEADLTRAQEEQLRALTIEAQKRARPA
jgi:integrase